MPLRNHLLSIEYDGSNFSGWQIQPQKRTIQGALQDALNSIFQEKIVVTGSGRTDAGVHATDQKATFQCTTEIPLDKIIKAINANLPDDIVVHQCQEVDLQFHPRFQAKTKTYRYQICTGYLRPAINRQYFYHHKKNIDFILLEKAMKRFIGIHQFESFCALRGTETGEENYQRQIFRFDYQVYDKDILFHICGDGFLYKMVRIIMGTVLSIASKKMTLEELETAFLHENRNNVGPALPAHGLFLTEVTY